MINSTDAIVDRVRARIAGIPGLEAAEVLAVRDRVLLLRVQKGKVLQEEKLDVQVSLRLISGSSAGWAIVTGFDEDALEALVHLARSRLESAQESSLGHVVKPVSSAIKSYRFDSADFAFASVDNEEKANRLLNLEATIRRVDPAVLSMGESRYQEVLRDRAFWTLGSNHMLSSRRAWATVDAHAIAVEHGKTFRSKAQGSEVEFFMLDWSQIAKEAARVARDGVGMRVAPSGNHAVVLTGLAAAQWIEHFSRNLDSEKVSSNTSVFGLKDLGASIASDVFTLVDDPFLSKRLGSAPWDDEGTPTERREFVSRGKLQNFATNLASSVLLQLPATGNGRSLEHRVAPGVGFHNLFVEPSNKDLVDLLKTMQRGILISSWIEPIVWNQKTGDFLMQATGAWVEGGEVKERLAPFGLRGNLRQWFRDVQGVGRDLRWVRHVGSPSLLCKAMCVE